MPRKKTKTGGKAARLSKIIPSINISTWLANQNKYVVGLLLICLGVSFYLRIEPVLFDLTHFSFDQGLDQILVKKLVVDQKISLISRYTGLEGVFMGPFYTWFMSIPFILSGGNPQANVIFFALLGVLSAVSTYFLVARMTNKTTATISSILVLISPVFVGASQVILSPVPITFLSIFYVYLIWDICINQRDSFVPVLMLLLAIFFQLEIGYAIFALPSAMLCLLIYRRASLFKIKTVLLSGLAFLVPFLPQLVFDLRHNFIITDALWGFFKGENTSLGSEQANFLNRIFLRLDTFTQDLLSSIAFGQEILWLSLVSIAIFIIGLRFVNQYGSNSAKQLNKILIILLGTIYGGFIVYSGPVWPWYRAGVPIMFSLLFAQGLSSLWRTSIWSRSLTSIFLIILSLVAINPARRFEVWSESEVGTVSTIKNQFEVIDFIYQDAQEQPFALYVYTPPVYPWIWDYQLWWYAQPTYGYLPEPYDRMPLAGNPNLIYLLIEPTDLIADRDGWKDNFSHFGEPIQEWMFASGIKVEKWTFSQQPSSHQSLVKYVDIFSIN